LRFRISQCLAFSSKHFLSNLKRKYALFTKWLKSILDITYILSTLNMYKALQVSETGQLELVKKEISMPLKDQVLIKVEACGMCGADLSDISGENQLLRVPGHEVIGRIIALGENVPTIWKMGQRVGVGRLGGHCNECDQCRQGAFVHCTNQTYIGSNQDGGYAELMLAKATGLVAIPEGLDSVDAAPLLCAGLATFNALKKSGAQAGDLVAIQGIGGLGHLALQYAHKMGFRVVAIGRGDDISDDVKKLGAHIYIDTNTQDTIAELQKLGGAKLILTTVGNASVVVSPLMAGLEPKGKLILLGAGKDPLSLSSGKLVVGENIIQGSLTGTPHDSEKTLDFSLLANILPEIETVPLVGVNDALQRLRAGDVKFRFVIQMNA
jgi:alcohol dehydrogenase